MQTVSIKITLKGPLLLASNTGDPNMVGTYQYIPARALRGLFANEYIKQNNIFNNAFRDERFYKWFLRGGLRFTDAFILDGDKVSIPVPLSVQKEKRGEGIYDLLYQEIDQQTKPIEGYVRIEDAQIYEYPVNRALSFHHSRDREKGTSKKGFIFNYESIEPNQSFGGFIMGSKEDVDEFLKIFKDGHYYLGRSRNNQYGKVYIEFKTELKPHPEPDNLKPGEIAISLISDTIIYNDYGFPVTDVNQLERIFGCKIKKAFIKTSYIESFVSTWRLKTPSEVSFMAGSTFLCDVPDQNTLDRLLKLREKGIGERTEEGFGRFIFIKEEGLQNQDRERESLKPQSPVPKILKDIITETLKKHILNLIESEAIKEAFEVKNLPTPSLIGRLLLMLKASESHNEFVENIKKLRRPAEEKLENCRVGSKSLIKFFEDLDVAKIEIFHNPQSRKDFEELAQIGSNPIKDMQFYKNLYRVYLEAFLTTLLKEAKKNENR